MNEVEKMYRNVGIEKVYEYVGHYPKTDENGIILPMIYPPFTSEKQLELIKLIANRKGYPDYEYFGTLFDDYIQLLDFNEALAKLVNNLWQDLTDTDKVQIKEVLE